MLGSKEQSSRRLLQVLGGCLLLASTLLAWGGIRNAALADEKSSLLTYAAEKKTAQLHLVAAATDANKTFNFNGYANGGLTIQVPTGWTVEVTFENKSAIPHSVLVAPWDQREKPMGFTPAFAKAAQADFETGTTSKDQPARFVFKAEKAGKYALLCGVPGHSLGGMWNVLEVRDDIKVPAVITSKAAESEKPAQQAATNTTPAKSNTPAAVVAKPDQNGQFPTPSVEVRMRNFTFSPATITIEPGTTVVWTQRDPIFHNVHIYKANGMEKDIVGDSLNQRGEQFAVTFYNEGTYEYECDPHPGMIGTIVVKKK